MNILVFIVSAGAAYLLVYYVVSCIRKTIHKRRIYKWLQGNTDKWRFRSTQAIASYNNLTKERVRYICSHHKKISLSIGEKKDMWSIKH